MTTSIKSYANFNSVTFQGRISNVDIVDGQYGEFIAVTVLSNMADGDDKALSIVFNNNNGLLGLHKKGFLPVGRQVTLTGHISGVSETYEKAGELHVRKRPQISLTEVQIPTGGLGPMPADKEAAPTNTVKRVARRFEPKVDATPEVSEAPIF